MWPPDTSTELFLASKHMPKSATLHAKGCSQSCTPAPLGTRPPAAPSPGPLLQTPSATLYLPQADTMTPPRADLGPPPNCPGAKGLWSALTPVSVQLLKPLKGLSGEDGSQPGLTRCLLEMGKELIGPTWVWEARASKMGSISSLPCHPPGPGTKTCPQGRRMGPGRLDLQPRGAPSHVHRVWGSLKEQPSPDPFSHLFKWEANVKAHWPPWSHPSQPVLLHTDTHGPATSLRKRRARGWGPTPERKGITGAVKILSSRRWASSEGVSWTLAAPT